jgi:hypothetical protein
LLGNIGRLARGRSEQGGWMVTGPPEPREANMDENIGVRARQLLRIAKMDRQPAKLPLLE